MLLLSPRLTHAAARSEQAVGERQGFNPVDYQPQYWMINGLSFPNTIHVGGCLAAHLQLDRLDRGPPGLRPVDHRQRQRRQHARLQGREGPDPHDQHGL